MRAEAQDPRIRIVCLPGRQLLGVLDLVDAVELEGRFEIGVLVVESIADERERHRDLLRSFHVVRSTHDFRVRSSFLDECRDHVLLALLQKPYNEHRENDDSDDGECCKTGHVGYLLLLIRVLYAPAENVRPSAHEDQSRVTI